MTDREMLPMKNAKGEDFALKFSPGDRFHGWIFYDNNGQWVSLRPAFANEMERAKALVELRNAIDGVGYKP